MLHEKSFFCTKIWLPHHNSFQKSMRITSQDFKGKMI